MLEGSRDEEKRVEIINAMGQQISQQYIAPFQGLVRYNVSVLAEGFYFAVFKDKNVVVGRVKFVVEH